MVSGKKFGEMSRATGGRQAEVSTMSRKLLPMRSIQRSTEHSDYLITQVGDIYYLETIGVCLSIYAKQTYMFRQI